MKPTIPFLRRSVLLLSCLVVLFTASCESTSNEVGGLVSASDATLSADLNRGVAGALAGSNVAEVSRRIDAFIAAHPDQKTTNASLRVRQAVMLLQNKQTNLAEAAFNQAALADLKGSTRDEALKRLEVHNPRACQVVMLRYFAGHGLVPGTQLIVGERKAFAAGIPVRLAASGEDLALGDEAAAALWVETVAKG